MYQGSSATAGSKMTNTKHDQTEDGVQLPFFIWFGLFTGVYWSIIIAIIYFFNRLIPNSLPNITSDWVNIWPLLRVALILYVGLTLLVIILRQVRLDSRTVIDAKRANWALRRECSVMRTPTGRLIELSRLAVQRAVTRTKEVARRIIVGLKNTTGR